MLSLLITVLCLLLLVLGYQLWQKARRISNIPGNLGFPIFGNLYHCLRNYWHTWLPSYYKYISKNAEKYGDISCLWFCHEVNVVISDPYLVDKLAFHPALSNKAHLVLDKIGWFVKSIFTFVASNKEWKLRRKEISISLNKFNLQSFHNIFVQKAKKAVEVFSKKSGQFDCAPDAMLLSYETIGATNFGMDLDVAEDKELYNDVHFTNSIFAAITSNPIFGLLAIIGTELFYTPRKARKMEIMIFGQALKNANKMNFYEDAKNSPISTRMALRNLLKKTTGRPLQRELSELLYAGMHTIAVAYSSALLFLATNPEIQEKVWQEQKEIFGDSDRDATVEDLKRMEYLERFFNETLRFCAPSIVIKTASSDVEIDGMLIPAGTLVTFNLHKMRFDERQWKNPKVFDPDRFLPENIKTVPKSAYIFYGVGIRNCPGAHYAAYFEKVMLSTVVRNFKLHSTEKFENFKFYELVMIELLNGYNISVEKRPK